MVDGNFADAVASWPPVMQDSRQFKGLEARHGRFALLRCQQQNAVRLMRAQMIEMLEQMVGVVVGVKGEDVVVVELGCGDDAAHKRGKVGIGGVRDKNANQFAAPRLKHACRALWHIVRFDNGLQYPCGGVGINKHAAIDHSGRPPNFTLVRTK